MPIFYPDILEEHSDPAVFSYSEKDVILYALSIGMCSDPLNRRELPFVYEHDLKVVPTAAAVLHSGLGRPRMSGSSPDHRRSTLDRALVVHGEQKIELHKPVPIAGAFQAQARIIAAYDKGEGKGAITVEETIWTDAAGEKVATLTVGRFARGDGGFGGPSEQPAPPARPTRSPDATLDFPTRPDQALLYRLNGDRNPVHADPDVARRAGFERPILHGMCTYGITCRAVLSAFADYDPLAILSHQTRFAAPVYPGDTLQVDLWREGLEIFFEARAKERGVAVARNGLTVLRR